MQSVEAIMGSGWVGIAIAAFFGILPVLAHSQSGQGSSAYAAQKAFLSVASPDPSGDDRVLEIAKIKPSSRLVPIIFNAIDRNADGKASRREFIASGSRLRAVVFDRKDQNHDNVLSEAEFSSGFDRAFLRQLDLNHDAKLSFDELRLGSPKKIEEGLPALPLQPLEIDRETELPPCWVVIGPEDGWSIQVPVLFGQCKWG